MPNTPEPLLLPSTPHSPKVVLDHTTGTFEVSGKSLIENTDSFYGPIISWLENFVAENIQSPVRFHFNLEYYNSGSKMAIYKLLKVLARLPQAVVCWLYHRDDEDIHNAGQDLAHVTRLQFEFIPL